MNILTTTTYVLQTVPSWNTGDALVYVGLFLALTFLVMMLRNALGVLVWAITGAILVLVIVDVLPREVYFMVLALSMLGVGAAAGWQIIKV